MKTQHTPTPWEAHKRSIRTIEYDIADLPCFSRSNPDDAEQEANAAFIVRCCNNHEKLVTALYRMIDNHVPKINPFSDAANLMAIKVLNEVLADGNAAAFQEVFDQITGVSA